jgi:hypothetical protein
MGLEAAQAIGLIGSFVSWNGQAVTLVNVNANQSQALIDTGLSSQLVSLQSLSLPQSVNLVANNNHFTSPGVFRPTAAPEAAMCSASEPEGANPALNACFNAATDEGLRESLRQLASTDPLQREVGREALREAASDAHAHGHDREFGERVRKALGEISREDPTESVQVQQAYSEVQSSFPNQQGGNAANQGGHGGTQGQGQGRVVAGAAGPSPSPVAAAGLAGPIAVDGTPVVLAGVGGLTDAGALSVAGRSPDRPAPFAPTEVRAGLGDEGLPDRALPAIAAATAAIPMAFSPFTLALPAFLSAASIGALGAPRSPEVRSEVAFFQRFFGPEMTENPPSDLVRLLTNPTPAFAPKLYDVRRAIRDVRNEFVARYGAASPADRDASLPLSFRYNPERRRIEVSIDPTGGPTHFGADGGDDDGDRREGGFLDLLRSPFRSLALYPIGSDNHRRGDEFDFGPVIAFVPVPQQYLQGIRLGDDVVTVQDHGTATNRGAPRVSRRDSAKDQNGGSHSGGREGRGSGGGRGHGRDPREDRKGLPFEDEERSAANF